MSTLRIGVDAGGTFTDFVAIDGSGRLSSFKIRSDPGNPAAVILEGIERITGGGPAQVVHGSTVATNALLERKGVRTAFLTTEGFEGMLRIGRQNRRELYNLCPAPLRPLVEEGSCFGVRERMLGDGTIERPVSRAQVRRLAARIREAGFESVAVCFLHSYRNGENEKAAAALLDGVGYVCSSHEVSPEFREYERASTTLINAYVGPLMDRYLGELERGRGREISILQSNGGSMTMAEARRQAVRTVLSGPAGGVVGATAAARRSGFANVLGLDMGGTSTDVSLAMGAPRETAESVIDGFPIRVPMLDLQTVGAGGGSIARVDEGGLVRVGPESAGADPGPACYGKGMAATVTDAHVVLGRIQAGQFLGGEMRIDEARSGEAVDRIAAELGSDRVRAAGGILRVANANMQRAIRSVSVERGYDPKDFALAAFGGCGGLHACEIAEELAIGVVIVPELAGMLSALGMLLADRVRDYAAGALGRQDFETLFRQLERRARRETPGAELSRSADLRYQGQSYELTVPWPRSGPAAAFHAEHEREYGYASPDKEVEIVTLRVRARLAAPPPRMVVAKREGAGRRRQQRVYTGGRWRTAPAVPRGGVPAAGLRGPALVVDYGATTLLPEGWTGRLDGAGNLIVRRN